MTWTARFWVHLFCILFANVAPILRNSLAFAKRPSRETATPPPPRQGTMDNGQSQKKTHHQTPNRANKTRLTMNDRVLCPTLIGFRPTSAIRNSDLCTPAADPSSGGCLGCVFGMQHCADLRLAEGAGSVTRKKKAPPPPPPGTSSSALGTGQDRRPTRSPSPRSTESLPDS